MLPLFVPYKSARLSCPLCSKLADDGEYECSCLDDEEDARACHCDYEIGPHREMWGTSEYYDDLDYCDCDREEQHDPWEWRDVANEFYRAERHDEEGDDILWTSPTTWRTDFPDYDEWRRAFPSLDWDLLDHEIDGFAWDTPSDALLRHKAREEAREACDRWEKRAS